MSNTVSVSTPPDGSLYFNGSMLKPGVDFSLEYVRTPWVECTHITLEFHVFRGESLVLFHSAGARIIKAEEDIKKGTVISV